MRFSAPRALFCLLVCFAGEAAWAQGRTGFELAGRSKEDAPPYEWRLRDPKTHHAVLDEREKWGVFAVAPGHYELLLTPEGRSAHSLRWGAVDVVAGKVTRIALDSGVSVLGRSAKEAPPADWYVYGKKTHRVVARTNGRWGFTPLPPGEYTLTVLPEGWSAAEVSWGDFTVRPDRVSRIALDSGVSVSGGDEKAEAPADWFVYEGGNGKRVARTYKRWGYTPLPPGQYELGVLPQGWSALEVSWGKFQVQAGRTTDVAVRSGISLLGRTKEEQTLEDWFVYDAATKKAVARTHQRWGYTPLPPGRYSVAVLPRGWSALECPWSEVTVKEGRSVTVDVDSGVLLAGRSATDPTLEHWIVTDKRTGRAVARTSQRWGFTPLPPGEYRLSLLPQGWSALEISWGDVSVRRGQVAKISIRSGIELTGAKDAMPPPEYWYVARDPGGDVARCHKRWGFTPLPPGSYTVRVAHEPTPFTTHAKVTADAVLHLVLTPAGFCGESSSAPAAPPEGGLSLRLQPGDTVLNLSWNAPPSLAVAGYRVYRAGSSRPIGGEALLKEPRFFDIGLSNGKTYAYRVVAVLADGSEWKGYKPASASLPRR